MKPDTNLPSFAHSPSSIGTAFALSAILTLSSQAEVTFNNFNGGGLDGAGLSGSVSIIDTAVGVDVTLMTAGIKGQDGSLADVVANLTDSTSNNDLGVDSVTNVGGYTNQNRDFNPGEAWTFKFNVDVTLDTINFAGFTGTAEVTMSSTAFADILITDGDDVDLSSTLLTAGTEVTLEMTSDDSPGNDTGVRLDFLTVAAVPPVTGAANLKWTGAADNNWDTATVNWADTDDGDAPIAFATDDNVTIDIPATITLAGGISSGLTNVSATTGTVSLSGGALTTGILTKSGGSTLSVNNAIDTGLAVANVSEGDLQIEAGGSLTTPELNLSGGAGTELIINDSTASLTVSGPTNLGATGARIRVATGASLTLGTITTSAAGAKLDKRSDGSLTITGPVASDDFPIDLDIIGGPVNFDGNVDVWVGNASNPNSINDPMTLNGTQLKLKGVNFQSSGSITSLDSGTVIRSDFNAGNNTINVPVILTADLTLDAPTGTSEQTYQDEISGPGSLTKIGNGVVTLADDNTYVGTTTVEAGTLRIGDSSAAGTLGAGDVILTAPGELEFRRNNFLTVPQQISGDGAVSVVGAGSTIVLTGANSYTGATTVNQGTLFVDGTHSGTGLCTVASGAAIGGNGSLAGDLTIDAGGLFAFDALSTLTVSGTVTLDSTFGVDDLDGLPGVANGTYTLIANGGDLSSIENFGLANAFDLGGGQLAYFQGSGLQLIVGPATTPFEDWMTQFTTLSGADLLSTADPDGDNVDNFTEFAFDGNPEDGSNNGRVHLFTEDTLAAAKLVLTVAVRTDTGAWSGSPLAATSATDGIDYTIEGSVDLSDFSSAVSEVTPVQDTGLAPLSSGYKWQSFTLDSSAGLPGKGFLRARASEVVE